MTAPGEGPERGIPGELGGEMGIGGFLADPPAFVLSGGPGHPFTETTAVLVELVDAAVVTDQLDDLAQLATGEFSLLIVNALWWRMLAPKYDEVREEWSRELPDAARRGVAAHVDAGRPVLAVHTASICFDDWTGWADILGVHWDWERSCHPELDEQQPVRVEVGPPSGPGAELVEGLDDFEVIDEVYQFLAARPDLVPLASSTNADGQHPLLWAHELPSGSRVVYDALGHDLRSLTHPTHAEILRRAVAWLGAKTLDVEEAAR